MKKETDVANNEKKTNRNGNNKATEHRDKMESPTDMNINMKTKVVVEFSS